MIHVEEHKSDLTKSTEFKEFTFMIKVLKACVQIPKIRTLLNYAFTLQTCFKIIYNFNLIKAYSSGFPRKKQPFWFRRLASYNYIYINLSQKRYYINKQI